MRVGNRRWRTNSFFATLALAALPYELLQEGEGTVIKLTAGLNETLCRFLGLSDVVPVGVATPP